MKRAIILVILLALMGLSERATAQTVIDQGVTGSLTWVLTSDSVLTISGSGAMPDYFSSAPWSDYRTTIATAIIGDSVTNIGNFAFQYCIGLTSITIPNSVTSIGDFAFFDCNNLISVDFNADSCISVGSNCWLHCTSLATINIGDNVKRIPDYAFARCRELTSITIPNSVTSIGRSAFAGCSGLASIVIPNGVTTIGDGAFVGCIGLTSITIPNNVTTIGERTFLNCSGLTSIIIPNSVTSIGVWAFYNCTELTSITTHATTPPTLESGAFYDVPSNIHIYIPCLSYDSYHTAPGWSEFTNFVVNGPADTTFYAVTQCYGTSYTDNNFITPIYSTGIYYITLPNSTNCDSVIILDLTLTASPIQELCMVSVDENDNNEIVWKQTDAVVSYNIYRERAFESYDLVANVSYESPNRWIDSAVNAKMRPYFYRIAGIDTCGNESELSTIHRTMYLTINAGQDNSWNLTWTPYEGVTYSTYNIYRASHHAHSSMELIGTTRRDNSFYTDLSAPKGYVYYMVEIVLDDPCVLTKSLSSIKSNIATNNPNIGIAEIQRPSSLQIFPNPTTGELRVENGEWRVESGKLKLWKCLI